MFVTPAYAQAAAGGGDVFTSLVVPMVLIFGIMYFLLIRPQQKKMKEHQAMVAALRRGDQIVTAGGLIGKVTKVKEGNEVEVEIASGVNVRVVQHTNNLQLVGTELPVNHDEGCAFDYEFAGICHSPHSACAWMNRQNPLH